MKVLYYNLQLGSFDGSNAHASGMLHALRRVVGDDNVMVANEAGEASYSHAVGALKSKLGRALDPLRKARKSFQSSENARKIVERVTEAGFRPDVLLARSTLYDTAPIAIARRLGCALVTESNTPFEYECCDLKRTSFRHSVRNFERGLYEASDGIYAVSSTLGGMLEDSYGIPSSKIEVIPNGYSAELYSDFGDRAGIRARVRGEQKVGDGFVVTFVGSLQTWHGIDRLIDIANCMPGLSGQKVVFWVLGDGPKRDLVSARADGADDFFWFGNVKPERMKELLYASDFGIMPYDQVEHFYFSPLKMFDMIGAGLPYIGLRTGQIAEESTEAIRANCLLDTTDPMQYARKIAELCDGDELGSIRADLNESRAGCTWDRRAATLSEWLGVGHA